MSSNVSESDGILELLTWLEVNKKRLMVGAVVVAVAGSAMAIYNFQRKQREFAASDALIRLSTGRDTHPTSTEYLKVVDEYAGTTAAERALILAAGAYFGEGRHGDAKAKFEHALEKYPSGTMRGIASLGVAACLDEMNKVDEAMAAYQGVVSAYGTDPVVHRAKLAMALLFETKKQPAQALKIYEELSRATPPTPLNSEARLLQDDLIKRHPELKPAVIPAASSTIMPTVLPAQSPNPSKAPAPASKPKK